MRGFVVFCVASCVAPSPILVTKRNSHMNVANSRRHGRAKLWFLLLVIDELLATDQSSRHTCRRNR
jgi:hypothetical protein